MLIKVLIGIGLLYLLFGIFVYPMFWLSGKIAEQEERYHCEIVHPGANGE